MLFHYRVNDRVRLIKRPSEESAEHLAPGGYDLVFVDGNHTYQNVRDDLRLMWPRVKPGGMLVGHDYTTRFPGVIQAVDESPVDFRVAAGTSMFYARKEA